MIALFFYVSPTVGESLVLIAFVVVCLGGFGSVPGALIAGLAIGVIQALSAYLIGAVYQDAVVFGLAAAVLGWLVRGAANAARRLVDGRRIAFLPVAGLLIGVAAVGFELATGHPSSEVLFSGEEALGPLIL